MSLEQIKNRLLRLGNYSQSSLDSDPVDNNHANLSINIELPYSDSTSRLIVLAQGSPTILLPNSLTPNTSHSMEILTPTEEDLEKLNPTLRAENLEKELEIVEYRKKIAIFTASPFGFLDQRLAQQKLPSPIKDFYKQIRVFRKQSRDQDDAVAQADAKLSDTAIVNVLETPFIQKTITDSERKKELLYGLGSALGTTITQLSIEDDLLSLNQELIPTLLHSLELVLISYLYKTGTHKLNDPEFLELVINKLFYITEQDFFTLQGKEKNYALNALFDFLSHFELNTVEACKFVLRVSRLHSVSHPLEYEAEYFLQNEGIHEDFLAKFGYDAHVRHLYGSDPITHKVGIEIEGVPLCIHGEFPEGFTPGIDGGCQIPEFRRDTTNLWFNVVYRKHLFDWWYYAKTVQFKGASLHFHIDDQSGTFFNVFANIAISDTDSLRNSQYNTVELRFNLPSYNPEQEHLDFSIPLIADQFHIVPVIEYLLQTAMKGDWEEMPGDLPVHWSTALQKIKNHHGTRCLSFDLAMEMIKTIDVLRLDYECKEIQLQFSQDLPRVLQSWQVMSIARESNYTPEFVIAALNHMVGFISLQDWLELYLACFSVRGNIVDALHKVTPTPASEELIEKIGKLLRIYPELGSLVSWYRNIQTVDELESQIDRSNNSNLVEMLKTNFTGTFTFEEAKHFFEKNARLIRDNSEEVFKRISEPLSEQQLLVIFDICRYQHDIVVAGLQAYEGLLSEQTVKKIIDTATLHDQHFEVMFAALSKKARGTITFNDFLELIEGYDYVYIVINGFMGIVSDFSKEDYQKFRALTDSIFVREEKIIYFPQLQMIPSQNRTPAILLRDFLQ